MPILDVSGTPEEPPRIEQHPCRLLDQWNFRPRVSPTSEAQVVHQLYLEGLTSFHRVGNATEQLRIGAAITVASWRMLPASEPTLAASATTVTAAPILKIGRPLGWHSIAPLGLKS